MIISNFQFSYEFTSLITKSIFQLSAESCRNWKIDRLQASRTNILEYIQHIYEDEELDMISTCRKFRQVQKEGNRMVNRTKTMYNLDMIISVGYRVNTKRGIKFRQWANRILKEYLIKGFVVNERIRKEQIGELLCTGAGIL